MGPLAAQRQRDRVEGYIAKGIADGATLATGGGRPKHLERGWFVEPTVFGNVDNSSVIAQEEIFGPVLSVIPAQDQQDAVRIANDTIYGLNASVFTNSGPGVSSRKGAIREREKISWQHLGKPEDGQHGPVPAPTPAAGWCLHH